MEKWKLERYADKAYGHSINNEEELNNSNKCGCFYCLRIYNPKEIKEWVEEKSGTKTALCPYCDIDAVIAESSDYELCEELLEYMYNIWF